jgi:hypothetical protein
MKPLFIFLLLAVIFSINANAQLPYQIGQPIVDGDGCPSGSVSATISPNGTAISIIFDQFQIELGPGRYAKPQMMRNCRFRIPLNLQPGYNIDVSKIDYRGFANLEGGNRGFIITTGKIPSLDGFTIGDHQLATQLPAGTNNFTVSQPLKLRIRNRCQPMPTLEFTSIIHLLGPNARGGGTIVNESMMMMIDSADLGGMTQDAITLNIAVTKCQP